MFMNIEYKQTGLFLKNGWLLYSQARKDHEQLTVAVIRIFLLFVFECCASLLNNCECCCTK